jgi:ApaG protein
MHGTYLMENVHNKQQFEVNIPAFEMITPFKYN